MQNVKVQRDITKVLMSDNIIYNYVSDLMFNYNSDLSICMPCAQEIVRYVFAATFATVLVSQIRPS